MFFVTLPPRNTTSTLLTLAAAASLPLCPAATSATEEETSWEHAPSSYKVPADLVKGGAFIDRILPMPVRNGLESNVWGGDNVIPRDADNGLEDPDWSYWCMSVMPSDDGKEHMFAVRWPEKSPKGHMQWPQSEIVHAVSDSPTGPFKVTQEIGPGHNVMCYRAKDGTYLIYAIGRAYTSKSLDGPWAPYDLKYDLRGTAPVAMSNHTFTRREDGSFLMVSRGGHVWISEDGLKPYRKITTRSAYPPIKGEFEDPVVWRDEVQYHLIVNDWFGRTAYYLRSGNGVDWVWDQGKAYDTGIARHEDGSMEKWYKFERPNVRQDSCGRATHMYFAVIDSRKDLDRGGDKHSSKIIALPLTVQRKLAILPPDPASGNGRTRVKILAEDGFSPADDIDLNSIRYGAPSAVDYGKGSGLLQSGKSGKDLVMDFDTSLTGLKDSDFVAKLLGKTKSGKLLFGYVRLPGHDSTAPLLSVLSLRSEGKDSVSLVVENFGQTASKPTTATIRLGSDPSGVHTVSIPEIPPYGGKAVKLQIPANTLPAGKPVRAEVVVDPDAKTPVRYQTDLSFGETAKP